MTVIRELMYEKNPGTGVSLVPNNGRNYYFLAEAYLLKDVRDQAREFNRLADICLAEAPSWRKKLKRQKERIEGKD